MSRNSITPSRAFFTVGVRVKIFGRLAIGPGPQIVDRHARRMPDGFGMPFTSTRHMRQLPAIDRRS